MKRSGSCEFSTLNQSCFVGVSWPIRDRASVSLLKVTARPSKVHYLSVFGRSGGSTSRDRGRSEDVVRIHPRFAKLLEMADKEEVLLEEISSEPQSIQGANVSCLSPEDWEILESNSELICTQLLNQLRVVYPGLKFPFWVTKTMSINLQIDRVFPPVEYGLLGPQSEITIPSLDRSKKEQTVPIILAEERLKLRVHPVTVPEEILYLQPSASLLIRNVHHAFIRRSVLGVDNPGPSEGNVWKPSSEGFRCSSFFCAQLSSSLEGQGREELVVKVFIVEQCDFVDSILEYFPSTNPHCIYIHPQLITGEGLRVKSYLFLKQTAEGSLDKSPNHFSPVKGPAQGSNSSTTSTPVPLIGECERFLKSSLSLGSESHAFIGAGNGSLLLEGKEGSGKSWLAREAVKILEDFPFYVYWTLVNCSKWRGKKPETLEKELRSKLEEASESQPSVLIFDNLDVLTPKGKSEQVTPQEEFLHRKTFETILDLLMQFEGQQISLIFTSRNKERLNSCWKSRGGFHFFHKIVTIPPLPVAERLSIFQDSVKKYGVVSSAPNSKVETDVLNSPGVESILGSIHDQYSTPRLIINLAKKWAIHCSSCDDISVGEFQGFIDEEIRFSDQGVGGGNKLSLDKRISWDSIGGLGQVKHELTKIIQWPIKYSKLFEKAPIKLPSGILLHGYPGTGKTLMGLSIPSLVHAKFIHIKGPELLSKYIGASEQAVQDVFKRARESSPCIIFFDEFESLVPRRGHDSTGVTDRVVNQFLAEMDGIEGGLAKGVYLIGATSRPDLIDPAVLRPGRLDKHLFFDLPSQNDRKEILKVLGQKVNLVLPESEWDSVSSRTVGYSGADLHSLICSSQLAAVKRYLDKWDDPPVNCDSGALNTKVSSIDPNLTPEDIPVTVEDLDGALTSFKPSLQGAELRRFSQIYQQFSSSREARAKTLGERGLGMGTRATLA